MYEAPGTVTSLDLIQNFMAANRLSRIEHATGLQLWQLGEEVRRFADSYVPPAAERGSHPLYVGGWPSANFWNAAGGPLIASTLLFSGQVYVKDPIIDWFSFDRYKNEHLLGSRQGFLRDDLTPDVTATREFLAFLVPAFLGLEPLIRSGAIVLVPGEATVASKKLAIEAMAKNLASVNDLSYREVCSRFHPHELAVDDKRKGAFAFAGGEKEAQLQKAVERGLTYFSREYAIAQENEVQYAAPWPFEQYLCDRGLMAPIMRSESQRVVHAVWASELPIFSNLTPSLVSDIRGDDSFSAFRAALFEAYRGISPDVTPEELAQQVAEAERALLSPHIESAERSAKSGLLAKLGVELTTLTAQMSNAFLLGTMRGQVDVTTPVQGATAYALGKLSGPKDQVTPRPIFMKLSKHQRKLSDEVSNVNYQPAVNSPSKNPLAAGADALEAKGWGIDDEPSLTVRVSGGVVLFESARPDWEPMPGTGSEHSRNQQCACGSGTKWKKCCRDVPDAPVEFDVA